MQRKKQKRKSKRKQPYKHGVPAKYTKGSKNPKKKAAEIKRTAKLYKQGKRINLKAVEKSRVGQAERRKKK